MTSILKGWTALTTRLLVEGGPSAWNVIDEAVGEDVCSGIEKELEQSQLLDKLLPARTAGEADAEKLMTLLMMMPEDSPPTMIRGDKSLYLSREYRRDPSFPQRHPNLHKLIQTVQTTLVETLSPRIQIDTSQTSVQLAVYPGDGRSGYVRHCDRGHGVCAGESPLVGQQLGRVVSAVYYLTNEDWHAVDDGGHLRLFSSDHQTTDVVPYRDRLVIFRADGVEHQVLPSKRRPRTAITMWFYGTILPSIPTPLAHPRTDSEEDNPLTSSPITITQPPTTNDSITITEPVPISSDPPPLPISVPGGYKQNVAEMSIFVSVASYRDTETAPTLTSLLSQSQYPNRIVVGLVLQLDDKEDSHLQTSIHSIIERYSTQIRCLRMDCKDATGPCYARALGQSLYRGEDYFLQIDSHMRFRRNWDTYLINLHQQITRQKQNDNRVMLTTYPVGYTLPNNVPNETRGTLLVPWKFDDSGLLRQRGRLLQPRSDPVPCHLIAAGFLFGPGQVVHEVPYDPSLHQLFFGEELSIAVRLFTHGYDCYAPPETVCYHLWSRAYRPTHRTTLSPLHLEQRATSLKKVQQQLLGHGPENYYYGLGTRRSVHDFGKALQVDFSSQRFLQDGLEIGSLQPKDFVPEQSMSLYPEKSLEHNVASLDLTTRLLISQFLMNHG